MYDVERELFQKIFNRARAITKYHSEDTEKPIFVEQLFFAMTEVFALEPKSLSADFNLCSADIDELKRLQRNMIQHCDAWSIYCRALNYAEVLPDSCFSGQKMEDEELLMDYYKQLDLTLCYIALIRGVVNPFIRQCTSDDGSLQKLILQDTKKDNKGRRFTTGLNDEERQSEILVEQHEFEDALKSHIEESMAEAIFADDEDSDNSTSDKIDDKRKKSSASLAECVSRVQDMRYALLKDIYGQDAAISALCDGIFHAMAFAGKTASTGKHEKPLATFLFAGPPGVGKTLLARKAGELMDLPFKVFDMSSFSDKEANLDFSGLHKSYKGSRPGVVTDFVKNNPSCVVLFDEIEKAHQNIIRLFYQILEEGRLRDTYLECDVSFSRCIIIFTTNAGRQLYENMNIKKLSSLSRKEVLDALAKDVNPSTGEPFFPAALCSRLASGRVVMFNHLEPQHLEKVVTRELDSAISLIHERYGFPTIEYDPRLPQLLLFSENVRTDARTVAGMASNFIRDKLLDFFRNLPGQNLDDTIKAIESFKITISVDKNSEADNLFERKEVIQGIAFASERMKSKVPCANDIYSLSVFSTEEEFMTALNENDYAFALIDVCFGTNTTEKKPTNLEDLRSSGNVLFRKLRERYPELPTYILETEQLISDESLLSFQKMGSRGKVVLSAKDNAFVDRVSDITNRCFLQNRVDMLARSSKVLSFDTAEFNQDENTINLYNLEVKRAVIAEDKDLMIGELDEGGIKVKFSDIIGNKEAIKDVEAVVDYIKSPKKSVMGGNRNYTTYFLSGAHGTGKTMLMQAMRNSTEATFLSINASKVLTETKRFDKPLLARLFEAAKRYAPSIIFIDDVELLAANETSLSSLFAEMDSLAEGGMKKPIFIFVASSATFSENSYIYEALQRRFQKHINLEMPDINNRKEFLKRSFDTVPNEVTQKEIDNVASRSLGMSYADLDEVVDRVEKLRKDSKSKTITDTMLEDAFETFCHGHEKKSIAESLEKTARHEGGHALVSYLCGNPPEYVTIVARDSHFGYMMPSAQEEILEYNKQQMLELIRVSLAGRAAEQVYYGIEEGTGTGASSDLNNATMTAINMLSRYGMFDDMGLGVFDYKTIGDDMSQKLYAKVNEILQGELVKARTLISENREKLDALVEALLSKNYLQADEVAAILGKEIRK